MSPEHFRPFADFRWEGIDFLPYKEDGSAPFRAISRQVLVAEPALDCQLRYFEMQAGGYSTLECHDHEHGVMILRGHGHCLVGTEVRAVGPFDVIHIPSDAWHQFRATQGEAFGFLCMVNVARDRPRLPTPDDLAALRETPEIAAFLDGAA